MDIKRITPKQIIVAYERTGLTGISHNYYSGRRYAGGLGAYASAYLGTDPGEPYFVRIERAFNEAGLHADYVRGFGDGWCGYFRAEEDQDILPITAEYEIGRSDGRDAWFATTTAEEPTPTPDDPMLQFLHRLLLWAGLISPVRPKIPFLGSRDYAQNKPRPKSEPPPD